MGEKRNNPRGRKKRKEITILEFPEEIWKVIHRCNANEFEILGALSRISMDFKEAWDDFMLEYEESAMAEGEDDTETTPPVSNQQQQALAGKKFDAMYV